MDQSVIGDGILALESAYDVEAEYRAFYEPLSKTFTLECFAKDSPEMESLSETLFWDAPCYFPLESSWNYCFRMTTYKDIGTSVEKAVFTIVIETALDLMPDLGGVSEDEWKRFTQQLSYTVNGEKCYLSAPDFLPYRLPDE